MRMCAWIGVSKSGYYHWKSRPDSATEQRRVELKERITAIFTASRETYGYRRVRAELARQAVTCGPELVRHLMRALDLRACQPRPWRTTTIADPGTDRVADQVRRDFTADEPGVKLVGDITYIKTWEGFCYLSTVIDCHTKAVIGWAIEDHMQTSLISDSIAMAARNYPLRPGCIFHSDRGTQYTSQFFRDKLAELDMVSSMGRTGVCWDNAMAESFFAALKNELVYRTVFPTRRHARRAVVEYIEVFYNRQRLHSGLDYKTPEETYQAHLNAQLAA
jgi:transposase InsO family protein